MDKMSLALCFIAQFLCILSAFWVVFSAGVFVITAMSFNEPHSEISDPNSALWTDEIFMHWLKSSATGLLFCSVVSAAIYFVILVPNGWNVIRQ